MTNNETVPAPVNGHSNGNGTSSDIQTNEVRSNPVTNGVHVNGNGTPTQANGHGDADTDLSAHPRLKDHIYAERHMRIICIGAGASGLLLAYKIQRSFENFDLVLYEKNENVAGTWFENKYPGCACDIPAHTYTWSFEPKADWSSVYAGSDEIAEYFESFADKYGLRKYVKPKHQVTKATWNASASAWDVEVKDLNTGRTLLDHADIVINASGVLNAWKWPNIPGLKDFKGVLLHTANYDRSVDLAGKRVGLIGNGSSGIQVLAAIQPEVAKLTTFVRGPTWVSPTRGFEQHAYSPEEIEEFRTDPTKHLTYRKMQESSINALFPILLDGSGAQQEMLKYMSTQMKEKLGKLPVAELLIPKYGVGCRRLTPGVGYLEGLSKENVEVVYGEVEKVTERGCASAADGREHELDVLICATGFDTSHMPRFEIVGEEGRTMREEWAKEAKAYFGMAVAGFPNYFIAIGPNSPVGNGPFLAFAEKQLDYILKFVNRWQTENIKSMSPKREAVEDLWAHKDRFMEGTVWKHDCKSWYKTHSVTGKVSALWPGSTLHFLEATEEPRYDDWNIKYDGNRFAWLGNGLSQTELDNTADWSYYIRNEDDSPFIGRKKAVRAMNKSGTIKSRELSGFV